MMQAHIEWTAWLDDTRTILLVRGWIVGLGDGPFPQIRWRQGSKTLVGFAGIQRPDVAAAFPALPGAANAGFSIVGAVDATLGKLVVEVLPDSGNWQEVTTLALEAISPGPIDAALPVLDSIVRAGRTCQPRALFILHDLARAGAQLFLLRLLQSFRGRAGFGIETLVNLPREYASRASEAEKEVLAGFESVGHVHFISEVTLAPENLPEIRSSGYGVVYANTLTLGCLVESLRSPTPVISHAHELGFWLERRVGLATVARQTRHSKLVVACARAVAENLVRSLGVEKTRIRVIHACASTAKAAAEAEALSKSEARRRLGIPDDVFVFAACGTFDWRKGADLFVPICVALDRHLDGADFRAIWIGPWGKQLIKDQADHEVRTARLEGKVLLLGAQSDPLRMMRAADCFALPSREDPFPIVMLEAATLGLPVVGFAGSGGVAEFVEDGAGVTVPYLDVGAFAGALARMAHEPETAARYGCEGASRIARLYDESISTTRILELVNQQLGL